MDEKKVVIIGSYPSPVLDWLKDVHPDDLPQVTWDSTLTVDTLTHLFSMECVIKKTDEEMEEIRKQEETRAKDQFKKMLSKPRRKR
ncbi:hypothetical protein Thu_195 [Bacillus phage Thurquoise]|nr:hypothetical protein Thu_195 [Bacillus phage Thurquoise]